VQQFIVVLSMWLIGISVCATLVYWMTSSAIESSKLAKEVQELRQMVQQLLNDKHNPVYIDAAEKEKVHVGKCPLCSTQLYAKHNQCPVCDYPTSY
jgi:hypothetical protein